PPGLGSHRPTASTRGRLAGRTGHDRIGFGSRPNSRMNESSAMATISAPQEPPRKLWTVADLYRRFGPIPFERIRHDPPPGLGTVGDVNRLNDHEDRLYELVDGILVMKTMGLEESIIAGDIVTLLNNFVKPRGLGRVAGEAGTI